MTVQGDGPDIDDSERREIDLAAIEACQSGPWSTAAEELASIEAGRVHNDRVRARGTATAKPNPKARTTAKLAYKG